MINGNIGQKLKNLRIEKGLKFEELANEIFKKYGISVNRSTLCNYESGVRVF